MAYNLKHTGAEIDAQIDRIKDGSVVVDNTLSALDKNSNKPVSGEAVAKELAGRDTAIEGLQSSVAGKVGNAEFRKESIRLQSQIDNIKPIEIVGDVTNAPDEEDITTDANNMLKLKDRPFGKGLGYKILRADKTFAEQVTNPYTIYEVRYDFDLGGETFELPENIGFNFNGGKIYNGVLSGALLNTTLNAEDYGIVYGEGGKGLNGTRIKILTGITSPIHLVLNGDVYIHQYTSCTLSTSHFRLSSPIRAMLNTRLFLGFSAPNIECEGVKIISTAGTYSVIFNTPSFDGEGTFAIKNCHIEGDVRPYVCSQTATSEAHKMKSVVIEDCSFESVYCSLGSNALCTLTDVIYGNLKVVGNRVHNMYSIFLNGGATNNSAESELMQSIIATYPRVAEIRNNVVYNDIDWKPWENETITPAGTYFCFCLLEYGDCWCENNEFRNLISYNNSATYDNYLSVHNLVYKNNIWENILDFQYGAQLMKSKTSGSIQGTRIYCDNQYKLDDVGTLLGGNLATPGAILVLFDSVMSDVTIRNNKVRIFKGYHNAYNVIKAVRLVMDSNEIVFDTATTKGSEAYLHGPHEEDADWLIQNNTFRTNSIETTNLYFISGVSGIGGKIKVLNNYVTAVTGVTTDYLSSDIMFDGNTFTMEGNTADLSDQYPLVTYDRAKSLSVGTLYATKKAGELRLFSLQCPKKLNLSLIFNDIRSGVTFIRGYDRYSKGIWNARIAIIEKSSGKKYRTSVNWRYDDEGYEYYGYDGNKKLLSNMASGTWLYVDGTTKSPISLSHGGGVRWDSFQIQSNTQYDIEIEVIPITDIRENLIYPDKVATEDRPYLTSLQAGATVIDTTLGKPIWWDGTKWVDATGTAV